MGRQGQAIGDIPFLCGLHMPVDVISAADPLVVIDLPVDEWWQVLRSSGTLATRWLTSLAMRIEELTGRMIGLIAADGVIESQYGRTVLRDYERLVTIADLQKMPGPLLADGA